MEKGARRNERCDLGDYYILYGIYPGEMLGIYIFRKYFRVEANGRKSIEEARSKGNPNPDVEGAGRCV